MEAKLLFMLQAFVKAQPEGLIDLWINDTCRQGSANWQYTVFHPFSHPNHRSLKTTYLDILAGSADILAAVAPRQDVCRLTH